jgi:hypothetical protein
MGVIHSDPPGKDVFPYDPLHITARSDWVDDIILILASISTRQWPDCLKSIWSVCPVDRPTPRDRCCQLILIHGRPRPDFPLITGVLMMRHCTCFNLLKTWGRHNEVTNARWHIDVETVDLLAQRSYSLSWYGWHACFRVVMFRKVPYTGQLKWIE